MKPKLLIFVLLLCALNAQSQIDSIRISISTRQKSFVEILDDIENTNPVKFFYYPGWFQNIVVPVKYSNSTIKEAFGKILPNYDLYYISDNQGNVFFSKDEPIQIGFRKDDIIIEEYAINELENSEQSVKNKYLKQNENYIDEVVTIGSKVNKSKSVTLNGYIKDNETGEPIVGATVYIKELKTGTVSDINGYYMINLPKGRHSIAFSTMGMRSVEKQMNVVSDGQYNVNFEKELIALNEVLVKGGKHHNIRGMQIGLEQISMKELKEIPLAVGEKDILKASLMLPGVQSVGESSAGYNVRGGSADQNQFLINNVPIFNTSHMFGLFSSFNPDVIKDFKLYKSNIPVEYGGRISSVFDIKTKQGNSKNFSFNGGISPVTARLAIEGPIIKDKTSYILGIRSSYSNWVLNYIDYENIKDSRIYFYDLVANISTTINDKNQISIFAYNSHDDFSLVSNINYRYLSLGASINWRHMYSERFYSNVSAIYSNYQLQVTDKEQLIYANIYQHNVDYKELKASFVFILNSRNELKFGINSIYYDINPGTYTPENKESIYEAANFENEYGLESAIYVGDRYEINNKLSVEGGMRFSIFNYLGPKTIYNYQEGVPLAIGTVTNTSYFKANELIKSYNGLDYRFSLRYIINYLNSIKMGYSRINQYLFLLTNTIAISPTDRWKLCDPFSKPIIGDQYNLGYYRNFENSNLEASIELYYKENKNVSDFKNGAELLKTEHIERSILSGFGRSYGVEFMIKKQHGKLTGWANYAYSKSELKFYGESIEETINGGSYYPANFDKPHSINVVANYKFTRRLSFSGNFTYSTGRPGTIPVSKYYIGDNIPVINYSDRNGERIPDYWRIDFSINLEGNLFKKKFAHSYWMLSVYNLTGRKNAYSVYYRNDNAQVSGYKLSIYGVPIITLSYNIKFGNYASN